MKTWLLGISALSLVIMTGPAVANASPLQAAASQTPPHPLSQPGVNSNLSHPDSRFEVNSSVQVSRDALREAYMASRDAYTRKLQRYAKCSPGEAKKAISSTHPNMKVDNFQLRNIRTSLVYMATLENDEDRFLVIVDAGNGKVLLDRPIPTHHERVFAGGE